MRSLVLLSIGLLFLVSGFAVGQTCTFATSGTTMVLRSDCTATGTITIPDGFTLNGNNHLISVPDSGSGLFSAGVLANGGAVASVKNLIIQTIPAGSCQSGVSNGIVFTGTSGVLSGNTLINVGNWNCNAGSTGITLSNPTNMTVSNNRVFNANGPALSVTCPSWPNCNGGGTVTVTGNEFSTVDCCSATVYLSGVGGNFANNALNALIVYQTAIRLDNTVAGFKVTSNNIHLANGAATGYGVYVGSDSAVITGNRVFNQGINPSSAVGIYNAGTSNPATNTIKSNRIRCYGTPVVNVTGSNIVLTCPW